MTELQYQRAALLRKEIKALENLKIMAESWCKQELIGRIEIIIFESRESRPIQEGGGDPVNGPVSEKSRMKVLQAISKVIDELRTEFDQI